MNTTVSEIENLLFLLVSLRGNAIHDEETALKIGTPIMNLHREAPSSH